MIYVRVRVCHAALALRGGWGEEDSDEELNMPSIQMEEDLTYKYVSVCI